MENEELIRRNMEGTRESLTHKLEALEDRLLTSVHQATSAVSDTAQSVKETMHDGVEAVKGAVDVPAHVDRHPWLMMGGSLLCGILVANLLPPSTRTAAPAPRAFPMGPPLEPPRPTGNGHSKSQAPAAPSPAEPSIVDKLLGTFEPELQHLKSLALGMTMGTVREILSDKAPPHVADQVREIIDDVTKKIGGEPIPSSDFRQMTAARSAQPQNMEDASFCPEKPRW